MWLILSRAVTAERSTIRAVAGGIDLADGQGRRYGVIAVIESLGLDLLEIRRVASD
jgi:hypothetical protein